MHGWLDRAVKEPLHAQTKQQIRRVSNEADVCGSYSPTHFLLSSSPRQERKMITKYAPDLCYPPWCHTGSGDSIGILMNTDYLVLCGCDTSHRARGNQFHLSRLFSASHFPHFSHISYKVENLKLKKVFLFLWLHGLEFFLRIKTLLNFRGTGNK